ncbi:MAG: hypothetical protein ACMZ7B_11605, partial [Balneola sp.]
MEDFFIDADLVTKVVAPSGLTASKAQDGIITLEGTISKPLDVLTVTADGEQYSILLKKSTKEEVEIVFDPK